jgi:hypothetical protein
MSRRTALVCVCIGLWAATAYEVVLAAGGLSIGPQPGDTAPGEPFVLGAALLLMALGAVLAPVVAAGRGTFPLVALVAPSAAAFALARFYTYDPYYAPTLRRMSDGGFVNPRWMYGLAAAAVATAVVCCFRPRTGARVSVVVVLACAVTTLYESAGH